MTASTRSTGNRKQQQQARQQRCTPTAAPKHPILSWPLLPLRVLVC
jgi:hypothetical protein